LDNGFEMFPEKGFESNTVSTINNSLNLNIGRLVSTLLEKGYRIVNGYGSLRGKTFRIGHMGEITVNSLQEMLKVLTDIVSELK
ncbi:hypothetical protein LCGC14_0751490, partial [marine sediment metagenome]